MAYTGDCVRIEQESLDRESYIVTVMQTGERGRVPKDFVRVGMWLNSVYIMRPPLTGNL